MPVVVQGQEYFRAVEVAESVGITRQTLWRWRKEGLVPFGHRYRNRQIVFSPDDVREVRDYANRVESVELIPNQRGAS